MTISTTLSQIKSLEKDISSLNTKISKEKEKEAKALDKIAKATKKISSAKTTTSLNSATREYQNAQKDLEKSRTEQAKLAKQLATKNSSLANKQKAISTAQSKEREKQQKELDTIHQQLLSESQNKLEEFTKFNINKPVTKEYDVFISHASEDKKDFVEPLAEALKKAGINIWYDSYEIGWGNSIRQSIDKGLINSRFCIVVLSPDFIQKYWTNYELNGIFQKASDSDENILLPIWHRVTMGEIKKHNLSIADTKAMNTGIHEIHEIVTALVNLIKLPNEIKIQEDIS